MIYLIITTCIQNRFGVQDTILRKERYLYAISETLQHLPSTITPVIVENNGNRETYLEQFHHNGYIVPVIYTNHNYTVYRSKAVNELLDIKEVIHTMKIKDTDMIIKLTGRYRITSPLFFNEVLEHSHDAFIKCYGVDSLQFDPQECILGLYSIRCRHLLLMPSLYMNSFESSEKLFIKYIRSSGIRVKELRWLDLECVFSDTLKIMQV